MIQANELRIGNWVAFNSNNPKDLVGSYCKVDETVFIDYSQGYDPYDPIPLTPEILEKAGFEFIKKTGASGADMWAGMPAWKINGDWMFRGTASCLHLVGYFNTQVHYLHQLQNLYFALTGTELQIEL